MTIKRKAVRDAFTHMKSAMRLNDVELKIAFASEDGENNADVGPAIHGSLSKFDVTVYPCALRFSPEEFWVMVAHELYHVATWNYAMVLDVVRPHLSADVMSCMKEVERAVSEEKAEKFAAIFAEMIEMPKSLAQCANSAKDE